MCEPTVAAIAVGLLVKQQADAQAHNQEMVYKRQMEAAQKQAAEERKSFEDQLANEEVTPTLINKSGQGETGRSSLRIKKAMGGSQDKSVGGLGGNTGLNIATS